MNKNSRTQNSIRNIITGSVSQLLLTVLQFICRTVFINTLGKEYLGINGLFCNIISMLSLTELGLDTAINFKLYKPLSTNNYPRIRALMKFYKYAYIIIGLIILALGLCLIPFLPFLVNDYDTFAKLGLNPVLIFLLFLLQSVSSYLFFASKSAIIKADQKEYIITITTFFCTLALNIIQIIILLLWKDFIVYTALAVVANFVINMINAIIAERQYKQAFIRSDDSLSKEEIRDIFKDLGALFLFKIDNTVLKATDNLVLSAFIGLSIVGVYSNYLIVYSTIKTILSKIYNGIKASMGNLYSGKDIPKQYEFFRTMNFLTFLLYGTAGVGVAVVGNELIQTWMGSDYVIPQPFSILMGIEILFWGVKLNLSQIRNVTGLFRQMWYRPLIGIAVNIIVSVAGVKIWGIDGVLVGTICANLIANISMDPKIIYKYGFNNYRPVLEYYTRNVIYLMLTAVITALDFIICKNFMVGQGWLSVIMHIVITGCSVPAVFCLLFLKSHECQYLLKTFRRVLKRKY